ncbi:MAG TPA: ABC-F family ATP-binding cassette domain-containing protein [Polyangiaceae bacterium]|jgi:ATPase subunit of ABC transporter with duplicated ATPase domains
MIRVAGIGKSYGARSLFEDVNLELNAGSRYGLVGANGSGKTTFLKIVAGDEEASNGAVTIPARARVGVLRQDQFLKDAELILHIAMQGDRAAWPALEERTRIIDHDDGDPNRLAELEHVLASTGGYTLEARASEVLSGLGIPQSSHRQPLATLSGGFKLRVLLAQVLIGGPDLVLLDEPTNHLDILSIRWLEKFLAGYPGTALVISHDQRFLDNVSSHILDVDYGTIREYSGNYSAFLLEKAALRERESAEIARAQKIIAEKRAFVDRFGAKATKAKQAQSRLKQIEKIEVGELAQSSRRSPLFRFTPERPSGRDVLDVDKVSKAYGEKQVLRDVTLTLRRGERVAVIGPNGLGKSTLLKIVMERVTPDSGQARFGHEVRPGYFAQDHHELLPKPEQNLIDYIWQSCPGEGSSYVRGELGRMLFSGDEATKRIGSLSGGEAARLIFCRLSVERPNLLLLDEPTNHLDLEAIAALVDGLKAFTGTVLFVSHDRWFVSQLATRILEVTPAGPREFAGTYAEYLERCGDDHLDADAVVLKARAGSPKKRSEPPPGDASWEEQKRERNRRRALPAQRDKLLAAIETAEARGKAIELRYAEPGFFERTPRTEFEALEREKKELKTQSDAWVLEWEQIESELARESRE